MVDFDVDVVIFFGDVNCDNCEDCFVFIIDFSNWNIEDEDGAGDCCNDIGVSYLGDLLENLFFFIVCFIVGLVVVFLGFFCQDVMFDVIVIGLMNMVLVDNNDVDYGICFVVYVVIIIDFYIGGINFVIVVFGSFGDGGMSVSIIGQSIIIFGIYFIYVVFFFILVDIDC